MTLKGVATHRLKNADIETLFQTNKQTSKKTKQKVFQRRTILATELEIILVIFWNEYGYFLLLS